MTTRSRPPGKQPAARGGTHIQNPRTTYLQKCAASMSTRDCTQLSRPLCAAELVGNANNVVFTKV